MNTKNFLLNQGLPNGSPFYIHRIFVSPYFIPSAQNRALCFWLYNVLLSKSVVFDKRKLTALKHTFFVWTLYKDISAQLIKQLLKSGYLSAVYIRVIFFAL